MVKEFLTSAIKKVTLELIYQVVNERTEEIIAKVEEVKKRQEDDFRYLIQKVDTDIGNTRSEIGQLRGEIGQLSQKIDTSIGNTRSEMGQLRGEIGQLNQKIDTSTGQINQRIDTIIQMLMKF